MGGAFPLELQFFTTTRLTPLVTCTFVLVFRCFNRYCVTENTTNKAL